MDTPKESTNPAPVAAEEAAAKPATDEVSPENQEKKGQEDASLGDMPSIFNTTKPKDIRDGLGNGLSNVLKGDRVCFLLVRHRSHQNIYYHTRNTWRSCLDGYGMLKFANCH